MDISIESRLSVETVELINQISAVAREWLDVEFPPRIAAEEETLSAANQFTEQALVFAINQQLGLLEKENLVGWAADLQSAGNKRIGVLNPGNIPFAGLQDFLGVILSGNEYVGCCSDRSPSLLPAFATALEAKGCDVSISFTDFDQLLERSDAIIASGTDETMMTIQDRAQRMDLDSSRLLLRGHRYSVALLDGNESDEDIFGLAEDILLHEGLGCRSVALIWAPAGESPDRLLDAMGQFRSTFVPHPTSAAPLRMQEAYLQAIDSAHAFSEEGAFLISKGDAEVFGPLHIRWSEYERIEDARAWITEHKQDLQLVVTMMGNTIGDNLGLPQVTFGNAQRPKLGWVQDGNDLGVFFRGLTE